MAVSLRDHQKIKLYRRVHLRALENVRAIALHRKKKAKAMEKKRALRRAG